jgi:hypothetical protein
MVSFVSELCVGFEPAKCDSLSFVSTAASSVDKWRMESMNIVVLIINEKSFADCCIPIVKGSDKESKISD